MEGFFDCWGEGVEVELVVDLEYLFDDFDEDGDVD